MEDGTERPQAVAAPQGRGPEVRVRTAPVYRKAHWALLLRGRFPASPRRVPGLKDQM